MLREIGGVRRFNEWRAYADLEPFDETRADLRAGSIVATLVNLFGRRKGQSPVRLRDCALRIKGVEATKAPANPAKARAAIAQTMLFLMAIHNQPAREKRQRASSAKGRR